MAAGTDRREDHWPQIKGVSRDSNIDNDRSIYATGRSMRNAEKEREADAGHVWHRCTTADFLLFFAADRDLILIFAVCLSVCGRWIERAAWMSPIELTEGNKETGREAYT